MTSEYNEAYRRYIIEEITPSDLYVALSPLKQSHFRKSASSYKMDEHSALEIFDEIFLTLTSNTEDIHNVEHWINKALHLRRIDEHRKRSSRSKYEYTKEFISETAAIVDGVETTVIKKETDHRQVIDSLLRLSPYNATTTAIVEAYLLAPTSASRKEISKSLNIHHEVIKRKLIGLSRYYDENRFGDYRDYLAV